MKLYLVRHATATEGIGGEVRTDADRPLISAGRKEAQEVASALKKLGVKPDVLLSSPLVRARQTAEVFAEVFGFNEKVEMTDALAPAGQFGQLCKAIGLHKRANEVILFGHQPDLTVLASTLLGAGIDLDMPFKKAGACRIDVYDCPPTTPGTLKWFITPKIASHITG